MIELTHSELFKDLSFIQGLDKAYDLHNNFSCSNIAFSNQELTLKIFFEPNEPNPGLQSGLCVVFNAAKIVQFDLSLGRTSDSATINNFYRGRFEKAGVAYEYSEDGEAYFYIEFEEGDRFELFASSAFLEER